MYAKRNGSTNKWRRTRLKVLERDNYICFYCGSTKATHVDHVTPKFQNGTDELSNLVASCKDCNLSKGSKSVERFQRDRADKLKKMYKQRGFFDNEGHPPTPAMFFCPRDVKTPFEKPDWK